MSWTAGTADHWASVAMGLAQAEGGGEPPSEPGPGTALVSAVYPSVIRPSYAPVPSGMQH
jgi:hypothetical protein